MQFIGIDFREEPERGAAFVKKAGVTYPSLSDESGVLILALQGKAPTVPTTLVLDTLGRIAARVNGPASATTLRALVDDVVATGLDLVVDYGIFTAGSPNEAAEQAVIAEVLDTTFES